MTTELKIRDCTEADIAAVQAIYAHHVLHGLATFETAPPSVSEMSSRRASVLARGLPYLVAEFRGEVVGYSYAAAYRDRIAYQYTIEDSVYVDPAHLGKRVGSELLGQLIARCQGQRWRQMVAVIGDSDNAGSIALHRRLDFRNVGTLRSVGFKLGRWVDTVIMQRPLNGGDETAPGMSL